MKEKIINFGKKYAIYLLILVVIILSLIFTNNDVEEPLILDVEPPEKVEVQQYIYIDIKGEIKNPGVYKVYPGTRLFQVVDLAGGLTEDANDMDINLSISLEDEDVVIIPSIFDIDITEGDNNIIKNPSDDLIDINNADTTTLQTLPGIGPATANKIIEYRDTIGEFNTIEDIMNVTGIGQATYEEIRNLIKV